MRLFLTLLGVLLLLVMAGVAAAIAFGGPAELPVLANANDPYRTLDRSALPTLQRLRARDGVELAYRRYPAAAAADRHASVVLVHGSASHAESMHAMARGLAQAGYTVFALDMRGHGASGEKGRIAYIGQLEDDVEDVVRGLPVAVPRSLVGFSAGGGFTLRFAADAKRSSLFAHYVLLSPFLGPEASTYRPASGGWASIGVPRVIALTLLNRFGVTRFNDLPVNRYALSEQARGLLTPQYSYALWSNFRPHRDYRADIAASAPSMALVVGADDEQFYAERFAPEFSAAGRTLPITIVPGTGHVGVTLTPAAIQATAEALSRLPAP